MTQYVLWRCILCNVYVLKFLRFVFLLYVQLRLVTYTYVNVYVVCIYLKVHKREKLFGSDFEFFTIL